jgi:hypothetical protein
MIDFGRLIRLSALFDALFTKAGLLQQTARMTLVLNNNAIAAFTFCLIQLGVCNFNKLLRLGHRGWKIGLGQEGRNPYAQSDFHKFPRPI